MRWLPFVMLAYIALGLQLGCGIFAQVGWSQPNLVLIAVIFIILNAPRDAALLGAAAMGALQDLDTQRAFGLTMLSYGITALCLSGATQAMYRDHPLTHFSCALFGGCVMAIVVTAHNWWRPEAGFSALPMFGGALYTAILAPVVLWPLQRSRKLFGFQPARRVIRPW